MPSACFLFPFRIHFFNFSASTTNRAYSCTTTDSTHVKSVTYIISTFTMATVTKPFTIWIARNTRSPSFFENWLPLVIMIF